MKKMIYLAMSILLTLSLFGCSSHEENSNNSLDDVEISEDSTTEEVTKEEITYTNILEKAREYFDNRISLSNYNVNDTEFGDKVISIYSTGDEESSLSFTVHLVNGIPLILFDTTTRELLSYGFEKGNQVYAFNSEDNIGFSQDVYLVYDEKYLHIAEDRVSDQQIFFDTIREVALFTDEDAVEFEYCGLTANSTFEDVINSLGNPTSTSTIRYDDETETCYILLGYSDQYHTNEDKSIWATFSFIYDYTTDTTDLYQVYLDT